MGELNDIDNKRDITDLDETDKLPVRTGGEESGPLCYICNSSPITNEFEESIKAGVYTYDSLMAKRPFLAEWFRCYRLILLQPQKHICRLSGISIFNENGFAFYTRQAPWDESASCYSAAAPKNRLLFPLYRAKGKDKDRLTCLVVHSQRWRLLRTHKAWSCTGGDIKIIAQALICKSKRHWKKPVYTFDEHTAAWLPQYVDKDDPFLSVGAQVIIRSAIVGRRRKKHLNLNQHTQNQTHKQQKASLHRLPTDIVLLIADFLAITDVTTLQKTLGLYIGDGYWRSRVPPLFHETLDTGRMSLDWEFLCHELIRLEGAFYKQLRERGFVLGGLDEVAGIVEGDLSLRN
ncbi:uncharacterized protein BDV14DRAFT_200688 [Aspergillus stella-maris]|uniref:uncharacterized protein n=1 Tax=Aspergillus stella-maris TaxID=1810926 RepID=UPI003CCE2C53